MEKINNVDICYGLGWEDEAKGKIVSQLSKTKQYDFVCRWAGGNNAGHTIYVNGEKYKTHLIPSGIFFGIKSIIGPDCVVNINSFYEELDYLKKNGFDISLIKISPKAHIITSKHIKEDVEKNKNKLGTTSRGIIPCYRDKYNRMGKRVEDFLENFKGYIWDEVLYGNILCEGAQGVWLDINYGNYPYVTSSNPLPYAACSLGFSPHKIRQIYGAIKIYDTRSGIDPDFPEELLLDNDLKEIGKIGEEYGVTGRQRTVNWLNVDRLIKSINISGCTNLIISKVDILEILGVYKYIYQNKLFEFENMNDMKNSLEKILETKCDILRDIKFSNNHETI